MCLIVHVINGTEIPSGERPADLVRRIPYTQFGVSLNIPHVKPDGVFVMFLNQG